MWRNKEFFFLAIGLWLFAFFCSLSFAQNPLSTVKDSVDFLLDRDFSKNAVRDSSVKNLVMMGNRAIPRLIEYLGVNDVMVRITVMDVLTKIGSPCVEPLLSVFEKGDFFARRRATYLLGEIKDRSNRTFLMHLLQDKDPQVRAMAARGLGNLGDTSFFFSDSVVARVLIKALKDPDSDVRYQACNSLGKVRHIEALIPLTNSVLDTVWNVRFAACSALRKYGRHAFEHFTELLDEEREDIRCLALENLPEVDWNHKTKKHESLKDLIQALSDTSWTIRRSAVIALRKIGGKRVERILKRHNLNEKNALVKGEINLILKEK